MSGIAGSLRLSSKRLVIWSCIASLTVQGVALQAVAAPGNGTAEFVRLLRAEQPDLRSAFDKDKLLDALDYDAEQIVDFVSNEVAFQPYRGVLRGVRGTLEGRSGNSHDQALTLASMLRDAGFDAQILVGELSSDQASELARNMAMPEHPEERQRPRYTAEIEKLLQDVRSQGTPVSELISETQSIAEELSHILRESSARPTISKVLKEMEESGQKYRWVRYRLGAAEPWREVHPAYRAAADWQLKFTAIENDQIDPSSLQTVGIELWIEDTDGTRHQVSGSWSAPAANLWGRPLSIELASNAILKPALWTQPDQLIDESHYFFVQIDGAIPQDALVFDLYGNVYPGAAIAGLNSLFATIDQKGRKAVTALNSIGADLHGVQGAQSQGKQLAKVWLSFKLGTQEGSEKVVHRTLFRGRALDDKRNAAASLLQRWEVDIATTAAMPQVYRYAETDRLISSIEKLERFYEFLAKNKKASEGDIIERLSDFATDPTLSRLAMLRSLFEKFQWPPDVISFIHEPNILAIRHGLSFKDGLWHSYELTDIVSNGRLSFRLEHGALLLAADASLMRGVWETRAEAFGVVSQPAAVRSIAAYEVLVNRAELHYEVSDDGASIRLTAADGSAWWEIDEATGSTVGMMESSHGLGGSEVTEYTLFTIFTAAMSVAFFMVGSSVCVTGGGEFVCCVVTNASIALVGVAIAWSVGLVAAAIGIGWGAGIGASVFADLALTQAPVQCGAT